MGTKQGERLTIVTDPTRRTIADAITWAGLETTHLTTACVMAPRNYNGEPPPPQIADAMHNSDVILIATQYSLTYAPATREAVRNGARVASMPGVTEGMMINGGLRAAPSELRPITHRLVEVLSKSKNYQISSSNGTIIEVSRGSRAVRTDDGDLSKPGTIGNLPAGEAYIPVQEGIADGVIVIDRMGTIIKEPLKISISKGRLVDAVGEDRDAFMHIIDEAELAGDKNARNLAEFGMGTNNKARYYDYILEAEKFYGTVHFAFGNNLVIGGESDSKIHYDGIILKPKVTVEGEVILENGQFMFKS